LPPPQKAIILLVKEANPMDQITRFVVWICSRFNRQQIKKIVSDLTEVLNSQKNFPSRPKDVFKEQHPKYRDFYVDPNPPLTESFKKKNKI
jgi:hypothetical protein